ncbi:hypothetical protein [Sulfurovum sp.]|jgi:hypothetical protein|uniref:hypothetical protein n=1 Tax=Sulfurovum sp. TaxID=1969726 RepID=UPI002A3645CE|nr:hypothetical protein [Sulfurovum sp.]MDD2450748.1 hypothetical protein [Sulfurovum sp.]MDD3499307.1 hypothetical protein [Sulfurovum sp.]MDY0403122.1 hypothetical protein [Sulfurovum sp.]
MKEITEYLRHKHLIFKSLKKIKPKELGSRKQVEIYLGVDLKGYYTLVMQLDKKSRVIQKEVLDLMGLYEKLEQRIEARITQKYILIHAPLCSRAKALLEAHGWVVWAEGV